MSFDFKDAWALRDQLLGRAVNLCKDGALADDLVQETFLDAWRARDSFITGKPLRPWLFAMLRNNFINSCRSRKVAETLDDFETLEPDRNPALIDRADLSIERKVMSNTLMRAVMQALEQLPPKFRVVFQLIDLDGRSYDEAMRTLNVPPGTIMSRLYEARALMCSLLPADLAAAI